MRKSRILLAAVAAALVVTGPTGHAANHREAPITALDHKADITDFFAFVSYGGGGAGTHVTFILCVDPFQEPANGPNWSPFDPDILYEIKIDNNNDAVEDIVFQFRFATEQRLPNLFQVYAGAGNGFAAPANSPAPVPPGTPIVPPQMVDFNSPGMGQRQSYSVTMVKDGFALPVSGPGPFYAVPSNVGPRTMNYQALFNQATYTVGSGIKLFAGTVDDPFWIDLGAAFDSLNFRPSGFMTGVPGVLSDAQDADDYNNYTPDDVAGFNVNAIAIQIPIKTLTQDNQLHPSSDPLATIGTWGTTSRPKVKAYAQPGQPARTSDATTQIQRMGNPLFNELIIGTGSKDAFSMSQPKDDAQFASFALDPLLARVLNAIYNLPIPTPPRNDLLPLVQYLPPIAAPGTPAGPVADLLRLNTGIPPTSADHRSRLAFLTLLDADPNNDDAAGFPNGRRVSDDVTDISARAVAGVLAGGAFGGFPYNRIGDGVNTNDAPYRETFPYVGYAHSGRDSRHVDPSEPGCIGTCPTN